MNKIIQELLDNSQPKIECLKEDERKLYEAGLGVLGVLISENFFDIPKLPVDKYSTDGLFYEIPYYDSEQLWCSDNQRFLLVIYHIKNRSSFCPLRLDFKIVDMKNYAIYVYIQWGERTVKKEFFSCENGECFSDYTDPMAVKLSDLLQGYAICDS